MTRTLSLLALALAALPALLRAQADFRVPEATLQPGDRLNVQVWRNNELGGVFAVAPDSTLQHPLLSELKVAGVPIPQVQARLDAYLRRFEANPRFVITPEYRIYVGGAVRDQNQFHLPEMSIAQAITRAGGSTAPNRRFRVRLVRDGAETRVGLNDPRAAQLLQSPIRSGDQILVEERPTFTRAYLNPAIQVLQTVGSLVSTYLIITTVFGDDDNNP